MKHKAIFEYLDNCLTFSIDEFNPILDGISSEGFSLENKNTISPLCALLLKIIANKKIIEADKFKLIESLLARIDQKYWTTADPVLKQTAVDMLISYANRLSSFQVDFLPILSRVVEFQPYDVFKSAFISYLRAALALAIENPTSIACAAFLELLAQKNDENGISHWVSPIEIANIKNCIEPISHLLLMLSVALKYQQERAEANSIVLHLISTLQLLAEKSVSKDWERLFSSEGVLEAFSPIDQLIELCLSNRENAALGNVGNTVLAKTAHSQLSYFSGKKIEEYRDPDNVVVLRKFSYNPYQRLSNN